MCSLLGEREEKLLERLKLVRIKIRCDLAASSLYEKENFLIFLDARRLWSRTVFVEFVRLCFPRRKGVLRKPYDFGIKNDSGGLLCGSARVIVRLVRGRLPRSTCPPAFPPSCTRGPIQACSFFLRSSHRSYSVRMGFLPA